MPRWRVDETGKVLSSLGTVERFIGLAKEDGGVKAMPIVLAIAGALAVSGIAVSARAQTERSAPTHHKCNLTGGPYPGFVGPYAYAPYQYGYPPDCKGLSLYPPTFYGYGYREYRVPTRHKRDTE
jgi:hypothetical protein